jgi:hypothetical protein
VMPALMYAGFSFWTALMLGCGLTIILYFVMLWLAPRPGDQALAGDQALGPT